MSDGGLPFPHRANPCTSGCRATHGLPAATWREPLPQTADLLCEQTNVLSRFPPSLPVRSPTVLSPLLPLPLPLLATFFCFSPQAAPLPLLSLPLGSICPHLSPSGSLSVSPSVPGFLSLGSVLSSSPYQCADLNPGLSGSGYSAGFQPADQERQGLRRFSPRMLRVGWTPASSREHFLLRAASEDNTRLLSRPGALF